MRLWVCLAGNARAQRFLGLHGGARGRSQRLRLPNLPSRHGSAYAFGCGNLDVHHDLRNGGMADPPATVRGIF